MEKNSDNEKKAYITINVVFVLLAVILDIISIVIFRNDLNTKLFCRVLTRGLLGSVMIYNAYYLLFTANWSFLCIKASAKQRRVSGILLGIVGLIGLVTALLGYGINGDPRLIWWK